MNPDDTLGGHQWSELPMDTVDTVNTDTYYLQHSWSENIVYEFVVFRNSDLVILNGSERMNKVCARMRWNYLLKEEWKQTYE